MKSLLQFGLSEYFIDRNFEINDLQPILEVYEG